MRRLLFGGKAHAPSLPEFVKLCRSIGHSDDIPDEEPAARLPRLTHESTEADRWAIAGNRRLLRYITSRCAAGPTCLGNPSNESNPAFVHNVKTLVAYKNRWVEVMQETATKEGVPVDDQMMFWKECIREAEGQFQREPA